MKTLINALRIMLNKKAKEIDELRTEVEGNKPPLKINVQKIEGSDEVTYTPTFSEIENAYNEGRDIIAYVYEADGSGFMIMRLFTVGNIPYTGTVFFFTCEDAQEGFYRLIITERGGAITNLDWRDTRIGELSNLGTTDKDDIVDAINELVRRVAALEGNA